MRGVLKFILKKSWGILLLGIIILAIITILNYDPLLTRLPWLKPLSKAVNAGVPIIAAIFTSLYIQHITLIYKLFERALTEHIKELNKVAKEFLEKIYDIEPIFLEFSLPTNQSSVIKSRCFICEVFGEIMEEYDELIRDLGVHWPDLGTLINELYKFYEEFCIFDKELRSLNDELVKSVEEMIMCREAIFFW